MSLLDEAGFKEADHPRGKPGNPGQFSSTGGGSSKIKGTGRGATPQPNFRGSLARETKGDTTQPVKSVDELYERAKKGEAEFKNQMSSIAKQYNSEVQYTPPEYAEPGTILKSRKSAERKIAAEFNGDVTQLRDVVRATIVSKTVEDTRKAAASFIGEHGDNILRVKDRIMDPFKGGYRDILINYRTPDGLVAEVQFNSKNMVETKNVKAHALYEEERDLQASARKARELPGGSGSQKTVEQLESQIANLEQRMAAMYESAYQADGDGKGWKKGKVAKQTQDSDGDSILRAYELSQEGGPSFQAAIVAEDGELKVISSRAGKWGEDEILSYADLIMPEQALGDWDVKAISPEQLKSDEEPDEDEAAREENLGKSRVIDRSIDIEYFTNESLGENRERTPEGFLICYDVPVARVGEMIYAPGEVPRELGTGRDGRVKVMRSAAEVFSPKSMASLNGKPVTDDHPPVDVDPANWKYYLRGVVVNPRRGDGEQRDFLIADLIVYDDETIRDIEAGKREVSCGYNPDYLQLLDDDDKPIPGRGEQTNILYNHLALVKAGRCGPACAIGDRKTVDSASTIVDTFFTDDKRAERLQRLLRRLS